MRLPVSLVPVVVVASALAWAQTPEARVCTDLSGKFRLPCPHQDQSVDRTGPVVQPSSTPKNNPSESPGSMTPVPTSTPGAPVASYPIGEVQSARSSAVSTSVAQVSL